MREVLAPWATGATYLNFIGNEGQERVRAAFGSAYDRLAEVKAVWDPDNVFRGNQNITPAHRRAGRAPQAQVARNGLTISTVP